MSKCLKIILLLYFLNIRFEMVISEDVVERDEKRLLDETAVRQGQFPFVVKLFDKKRVNHCIGTLLSPTKVLTVAHCLHERRIEFIVAGSIDTKTKGQRRKVSKYVLHPKYVKFQKAHRKRIRGNNLGMATANGPLSVLENPAWIAVANEIVLASGLVIGGNGLDVTLNEGLVKPEPGQKRKPKCIDDGRMHFSKYEIKYKRTTINEDSPVFVSRAKDSGKAICGSVSGGPLVTKDPPYLLLGVHIETDGIESYDISVLAEDNRKWILSQLGNKTKVSSRRNGQKGI